MINDEYALNKLSDKIKDIKHEKKKNKSKTNPLFLQDIEQSGHQLQFDKIIERDEYLSMNYNQIHSIQRET